MVYFWFQLVKALRKQKQMCQQQINKENKRVQKRGREIYFSVFLFLFQLENRGAEYRA